jgi:hypothetical protein
MYEVLSVGKGRVERNGDSRSCRNDHHHQPRGAKKAESVPGIVNLLWNFGAVM